VPTTPDRISIFQSPILIFLSLAIWRKPLASLFALALRDEHYTHILLILPISVAFIFLGRKSTASRSGLSATVGSALLVAALIMRFFTNGPSAADVQLSLSILGFVAWWIGSFILCFGMCAFRRTLFPLGFLLWMVPLPQILLNPIVALLQQGSAASAHFFFAVAGIPIEQRGMLLHLPGLTLEVASECSSIRSSMMLLVTTMVLAQLLLLSFWRKAVVVAVAIPLSVVKNGIRIFVLGVLATKVDPSYLAGRLHRHGGIIYFLVALLGIFLLIWILRRGEDHTPQIAANRPLEGNSAD